MNRDLTYHFERPDPPDPNFQLALYAFHVLEFDTLPPASTSRLPPEKKQLLGHTNSIAVREVVALDVGSEPCQCNATDDRFIGLASAVSPFIVMVETTDIMLANHSR